MLPPASNTQIELYDETFKSGTPKTSSAGSFNRSLTTWYGVIVSVKTSLDQSNGDFLQRDHTRMTLYLYGLGLLHSLNRFSKHS